MKIIIRYVLSIILLITLFSYVESQSNNSTPPKTSQPVNTINEEDPELSDSSLFPLFQQFLKDFDRSYESLNEINSRFAIFKENYKKVLSHQRQFKGRKDKHSLGITKFMDVKPEHFKATYNTARVTPEQLQKAKNTAKTTAPQKHPANLNQTKNANTNKNPSSNPTSNTNTNAPPTLKDTGDDSLPSSWDWRTQGGVSPVKNQGPCGSCWAHSAIANIESLYAIKYGAVRQFSEQQLMDCDYEADGCIGGNQEEAFTYLMGAGGAESLSAYPYLAYKSTCRFNSNYVGASVASYFFISGDEDVMKTYVYNGPIGIIFNANMLQYYTGGIISADASECDPSAIDHAVLIVGWGTSSSGTDYWIVKNSYGPDWGENGYFRIVRGQGTCGVNQYVISSVLS